MSTEFVLVTSNGTKQRDIVWVDFLWDRAKKDYVGSLHETARGDRETIEALYQFRKESNHAN